MIVSIVGHSSSYGIVDYWLEYYLSCRLKLKQATVIRIKVINEHDKEDCRICFIRFGLCLSIIDVIDVI